MPGKIPLSFMGLRRNRVPVNCTLSENFQQEPDKKIERSFIRKKSNRGQKISRYTVFRTFLKKF